MAKITEVIDVFVAARSDSPKDGLMFEYSSSAKQIFVGKGGDIDFLNVAGTVDLVFMLDNTHDLIWTKDVTQGATQNKAFYDGGNPAIVDAIEFFKDPGKKIPVSGVFTLSKGPSKTEFTVSSARRTNSVYYYSINVAVPAAPMFPKFIDDPQIINGGNGPHCPGGIFLRFFLPIAYFLTGALLAYAIAGSFLGAH